MSGGGSKAEPRKSKRPAQDAVSKKPASKVEDSKDKEGTNTVSKVAPETTKLASNDGKSEIKDSIASTTTSSSTSSSSILNASTSSADHKTPEHSESEGSDSDQEPSTKVMSLDVQKVVSSCKLI